ncbi:MAG: hypothetical protein ACLRRQ_12365 [Lachnospira pectinoschiza]
MSNRESGRGRYDAAMYPLQDNMDAFLMVDLKVHDEKARSESGSDCGQRSPSD